MGSICKASDMRLNCICAVKELIPSYGEAENVEWFEREANIGASLSHYGLPNVSDYFIWKKHSIPIFLAYEPSVLPRHQDHKVFLNRYHYVPHRLKVYLPYVFFLFW